MPDWMMEAFVCSAAGTGVDVGLVGRELERARFRLRAGGRERVLAGYEDMGCFVVGSPFDLDVVSVATSLVCGGWCSDRFFVDEDWIGVGSS